MAWTECRMEFPWIFADATQRMVSDWRDLVVGKVDESAFSMDGYEVMDMSGYGR